MPDNKQTLPENVLENIFRFTSCCDTVEALRWDTATPPPHTLEATLQFHAKNETEARSSLILAR